MNVSKVEPAIVPRRAPLAGSLFVRMRRPDGMECVLTVDANRLQEVMDTAARHFGGSQ